jgi:hypothetical protein
VKDIKRMGGKGLLEAEVATNAGNNAPRRFVYERMKSHLRDAAATAAEAWAAGMAEGLARYGFAPLHALCNQCSIPVELHCIQRDAFIYRYRNKKSAQISNNRVAGKESQDSSKAAVRLAAYEKRRMQQRVAKQLDLDGDWGSANAKDGKSSGEDKETAADIIKMLWTVENLLTVETEWFTYEAQFFARIHLPFSISSNA